MENEMVEGAAAGDVVTPSPSIAVIDPASTAANVEPQGLPQAEVVNTPVVLEGDVEGERRVWKGKDGGYKIIAEELKTLANGNVAFLQGVISVAPGVTTDPMRIFNRNDLLVLEKVRGKAYVFTYDIANGELQPPVIDQITADKMRLIVFDDEDGSVFKIRNYGLEEAAFLFWFVPDSSPTYQEYQLKAEEQAIRVDRRSG